MDSSKPGAVNVADLMRNGLILHTREAVALTVEVCGRGPATGGNGFARDAGDLWIGPTGDLDIVLSGTPAPITDVRLAAAALLTALLPRSSDLPQYTVVPALRNLPQLFRESAAKIPPADRHLHDVQAMLHRYLSDDPRLVLQQLVSRAGKKETAAHTGAADLAAADVLSTFALESETAGSEPPPEVRRERDPEVFEPAPEGSDSTNWPLAPDPSAIPPGRDAREVAPVRNRDELPARRRTAWPAAWLATAAVLIAASGFLGFAFLRWVDSVKAGSHNEGASAPPRTTTEVTIPPRSEASRDAAVTNPDHPAAVPPKPSESVVTDRGDAPVDGTHALMLPVRDGAFSPSFAPSGRTLLFHAGRNTGRLMEADLDDRDAATRVSPVLAGGDTQADAKNYHVRLSPDGRLIAFDSEQDGERGVYVASVGGADARRVSGTGYAAVPTWSPDMNWLAFVRAEPGRSKVWNLWLLDRRSGTLKRQTSFRFGQVWGASWFPDSRRICYSHENQLTIADISTGSIQTFGTPRSGHLVRTPAVSPDGRRIVFQVQRDGVWMLDLKTQAMTRLLSDATAEEFAWQPDGKRIAYHSRRDGQWRIWITTPP